MSDANLFLGLSNLVCAAIFTIVAVPLVRRKVKMNRWYGIRVKKAFESNDNWYRINAYAGRRLLLYAVVLAAVGVLTLFMPLQHRALRILLGHAPLIAIVPCIEAVIFARRL